jgi:hypothetical protein
MSYTDDEKAHLLYDRLAAELSGIQFDLSAEVLSAIEAAKTSALEQATTEGIIEEGEYGLEVRVQENFFNEERSWTHTIFVFKSTEPPPAPPPPAVADAP